MIYELDDFPEGFYGTSAWTSVADHLELFHDKELTPEQVKANIKAKEKTEKWRVQHRAAVKRARDKFRQNNPEAYRAQRRAAYARKKARRSAV